MEGNVDLAVDQLVDLGVYCFVDGGVAVAEVGDANAAGEVEVFSTFGGGYIATCTSLEDVGRESAYAFGYVLGAELGEFGHRHYE